MSRVASVAAYVLASTLPIFASAAPPTKNTPPSPLMVVDATGKIVGRLTYAQGSNVVVLPANGVLTSYFVAPSYMAGYGDYEKFIPLSQGTRLRFVDNNCSGTPYMQDGSGTRSVGRQSVVALVQGQSRLYVAQAGAPTFVAFASFYEAGVCNQGAESVWAVPLQAPINLSVLFAEPYTVQ